MLLRLPLEEGWGEDLESWISCAPDTSLTSPGSRPTFPLPMGEEAEKGAALLPPLPLGEGWGEGLRLRISCARCTLFTSPCSRPGLVQVGVRLLRTRYGRRDGVVTGVANRDHPARDPSLGRHARRHAVERDRRLARRQRQDLDVGP